MRGGTLDAVPVVDAALARLVVDIEVLQVVVEVNGAGTEVAAEEGSMSSENCCDVNMALSAQGDGEAGLPLVEVRYNGGR